MLESLAFIFLIGLSMAAVCQKLKIPRIVGMLFTGVVLGPYVLNLLDQKILGISAELRQVALIIILIKAGLTLNLSDLKKVGRPAILMAFVPACFELLGYVVVAPALFHISRLEAAVMGAVMAAVSPAVVVPRMVSFIEKKRGTAKSIPQMILAGASCDDIFVIVLFSTFLNMAQGGHARFIDFTNIPVSILAGITVGAVTGWCLAEFFEKAYEQKHLIRNSMKVIVVLGMSFFLMSMENWMSKYIPMSGLLAVVSMACVLKKKSVEYVANRLSEKFGKLWLAAEVILFVLVGAAVDIRYMIGAGILAVEMILVALVFRTVGVFFCLLHTSLNWKERCFCVIAYLPKATVQAAIGSVPLAMGLPCGKLILSVAVLAIVVTAPLGAWGIDTSWKKLLMTEEE